MIKFGSLRLSRPWWGVVGRAAAMVVVIVIGAEGLVRIPMVQAQFLLPMLPGHYELGGKEYMAGRLYAETGKIDCFFVGNSIIGRGIKPEEFSRTYQIETGKQVNCFNFGIDTLTFRGAKTLSQILIRRYHPAMIVIGVHYENFTHSASNGFDLDTAWARFQLGQISADGFFESTFLSYRDAMTAAQGTTDLNLSEILTGTLTAHGWRGSGTVQENHKLTRKNSEDLYAALDTLDFDGYQGDLDALLGMDTQGTQLVVVDMPLPTITFNVVKNYDYPGYLATVRDAAAAEGIPFIDAPPPELIPVSEYQDHSHLNAAGATAFSWWLGRAFGKMFGQTFGN